MTIGIIGAGSIGTAFARGLSRANIRAILSNSRGPDSLKDVVADIGGAVRRAMNVPGGALPLLNLIRLR